MSFQTVFKRYEIKYKITQEQKETLIRAMAPYMELDCYGRSVIRNLYYDTENYRLVRKSIEKPVYKEKLRVRSYGKATPEAPVFVELKKKYQSVVYKRRLALPEKEAMNWLQRAEGREENMPCRSSQIGEEIEYFRQYYETLRPAVFLSYEREAYRDKEGSDFRVTFDENILARQEKLSLCEEPWGERLMDSGYALMEIKTSGGMPLWMVSLLTEQRIFHTSFSKYGTAYKNIILNK